MKNIALAVVLAAIGASIWYLDSLKSSPAASGIASVAIPVPAAATMPSSESAAAPARLPAPKKYPRAIEIASPTGFINADPFKIGDLVGKKVVLVDFWTYSCINCERTIPYLNAWYEKYRGQGLEIVGVHTPEFEFEKKYDNVAAAVKKFGIRYPVVLDSDNGTWNAYQNRYWPHEFLIDIDGYIVHDHIGEGGYAETERAIQAALAERADRLGMAGAVSSGVVRPSGVGETFAASPEAYFGAARNAFLGNGIQAVRGDQSLAVPAEIKPDTLYLDGAWHFEDEYATNASAGAKIVFRYSAKSVYFVASAKDGAKLRILRDGKPLGAAAGDDVGPDSAVMVKDDRLYKLITDPAGPGTHTVEIIIEKPGLSAFTFTFG